MLWISCLWYQTFRIRMTIKFVSHQSLIIALRDHSIKIMHILKRLLFGFDFIISIISCQLKSFIKSMISFVENLHIILFIRVGFHTDSETVSVLFSQNVSFLDEVGMHEHFLNWEFESRFNGSHASEYLVFFFL